MLSAFTSNKRSILFPLIANKSGDDPTTAPGNDRIRLRRIGLVAEADDPLQQIYLDTPIHIEVEYWNLVPDVKVVLNLCIYSIEGSDVFEDWTAEEANWRGRAFPRGLFRTTCQIPGNLFNEGTFRIRILFFELESTAPSTILTRLWFFPSLMLAKGR